MYQQRVEDQPGSGQNILRKRAASNSHRLILGEHTLLLRLLSIAVIIASSVSVLGLGGFLLVEATLPIDPASLPCVHWDLSGPLGDPVPQTIEYARTTLTAELEHAIEKAPTCANLYWALGDVELWLGERARALASYQRYLKFAGSQSDPEVNGLVQRLEPSLMDNAGDEWPDTR